MQCDQIKYKRPALLINEMIYTWATVISLRCKNINFYVSNIYELHTVNLDVLHGQTLLTTDTDWWRISTE